MLDVELLCAECSGHLGWLLESVVPMPCAVLCDECHRRAQDSRAGQLQIDYERSVREQQGMGLPFVYRDPLLQHILRGEQEDARISIGAFPCGGDICGIALWISFAFSSCESSADAQSGAQLARTRALHARGGVGRVEDHPSHHAHGRAAMNASSFQVGELAIVVGGVDPSVLGAEVEVVEPLRKMLTLNYHTREVRVLDVYEIRLLASGQQGCVVPSDLRKRPDRQDWLRLCGLPVQTLADVEIAK